mmetsp:Transcript_1526/g.4546  ORF Transcript_1526/g.4546 Transcript_1526/m.4546 type:complete len:200 (+) Transcript_1526:271-870(+)
MRVHGVCHRVSHPQERVPAGVRGNTADGASDLSRASGHAARGSHQQPSCARRGRPHHDPHRRVSRRLLCRDYAVSRELRRSNLGCNRAVHRHPLHGGDACSLLRHTEPPLAVLRVGSELDRHPGRHSQLDRLHLDCVRAACAAQDWPCLPVAQGRALRGLAPDLRQDAAAVVARDGHGSVRVGDRAGRVRLCALAGRPG